MGKGSGGKGARGGRSNGGGEFSSTTDEQMMQDNKEWGENLTKSEQQALHDYQADGFRLVNSADRGLLDINSQPKLKLEYERLTRGLDSAIEKGKLDRNTTVYRSITNRNKAYLDSLQPGTTHMERGYTSTTVNRNRDLYKNQPGHARIEYRVPKGTKGAYMNANPGRKNNVRREQEFLLGRGTRYRVVSREVGKDGTIRIIVEVI